MILNVSVLGEEIIARDLTRISANMEDWRPAFRDLFDLFEASERRQFNTAGSYGSGGWQALAPITVQRKKALGLDNGILRATGAMESTLTDGGAAGAIRQIAKTRAVFGTEDPKAIFHQLGTANMPRRRPVQLPEADRRAGVEIFQRAAFAGVKGA